MTASGRRLHDYETPTAAARSKQRTRSVQCSSAARKPPENPVHTRAVLTTL
jgi:hypothetical protein